MRVPSSYIVQVRSIKIFIIFVVLSTVYRIEAGFRSLSVKYHPIQPLNIAVFDSLSARRVHKVHDNEITSRDNVELLPTSTSCIKAILRHLPQVAVTSLGLFWLQACFTDVLRSTQLSETIC